MKSENSPHIIIRSLDTSDFENLFIYLNQLSLTTRKRFGPHAFDRGSIIDFYRDLHATKLGYIALNIETGEIVAYAIIKTGYLDHEIERLQAYGLKLNPLTDCAFAPSVADKWQGKGIGNQLLHFIINDLKTRNIKRILLWGGVQADNERAIRYYQKNDFVQIGQFEYNGLNNDMILHLAEC